MNNYQLAHINLVAKTLEELYFEELFQFVDIDGVFRFSVSESIYYEFNARLGQWDNCYIERASLKKYVGLTLSTVDATQFLVEIKSICKMDDQTLAGFIEEALQTLHSDEIQYDLYDELDFSQLANKRFVQVDQILPGHPKVIMNKGRIGFNSEDLSKFTPESRELFHLYRLSAHPSIIETFSNKHFNFVLSDDGYYEFFVHPWQWDKYIKVQFSALIKSDLLRYVGETSERYTAQVSLRTLSCCDDDQAFDIKLPLSILNTSCVRGLPKNFLKIGHLASEYLTQICRSDKLLQNVQVLEEVAALSIDHPQFNSIENCSYRYHELLGCVWRESVSSKLNFDEKAFSSASLIFSHKGNSILKTLVNSSSVTESQWLKSYAKEVIIPLYHLQLQHGVGLVAHGQNTIVVFKDNIPSGLILKDFHGDFRVNDSVCFENEALERTITKLPAHFLIHDLITGHFISVLRYLYNNFYESFDMNENEFYKIIGDCIHQYLSSNEPKYLTDKTNLMRDEFEKVLVNRVRFECGYSETNSRLKPMLGKNLKNPFAHTFHNEVVYE